MKGILKFSVPGAGVSRQALTVSEFKSNHEKMKTNPGSSIEIVDLEQKEKKSTVLDLCASKEMQLGEDVLRREKQNRPS